MYKRVYIYVYVCCVPTICVVIYRLSVRLSACLTLFIVYHEIVEIVTQSFIQCLLLALVILYNALFAKSTLVVYVYKYFQHSSMYLK